ncbi:unnamed protein product [Thelazia callipaeda]|uniref:EGF-like domain-containing protein n=1 Tax=Thelazia callipaeda TaxID=103827 RepID=A0A0N5CXX0_THECL|nr:unnamed protein product [Thelazia callipaeda]
MRRKFKKTSLETADLATVQMKTLSVLLYIAMYISSTRLIITAQQRKAFVNPQSDCRVQCLNGGYCAYLVDNPTIHTCLCLLNVFYGDRCEYAVAEGITSTPNINERSTSTNFAFRGAEVSSQHGKLQNFKNGRFIDDSTTTYDNIAPTKYTEMYQMQETSKV